MANIDWRDVASLTAAQDQDCERALKWWRETLDADKIRLWDAIQKDYPNPMTECMTRFAEIGMTHIALMDATATT